MCSTQQFCYKVTITVSLGTQAQSTLQRPLLYVKDEAQDPMILCIGFLGALRLEVGQLNENERGPLHPKAPCGHARLG